MEILQRKLKEVIIMLSEGRMPIPRLSQMTVLVSLVTLIVILALSVSS